MTSSNRFQLLPYWRSLVVFLVPILFLPLPLLSKTPEARCGYVILIMAVFWMTEALPLAVTALIPLVGFPLLGVMSTGELCLVYMKETNMMFLGGLTVAICVEHCNLHRRIAIFVLLHVGQSPQRLMAGFMLTTMFLSMWISNTASTAMMVPIVDAILVELYSRPTGNVPQIVENDFEMKQEKHEAIEEDMKQIDDVASHVEIKPATDEEEEELDLSGLNLTFHGNQMRKALLLAVAYSANIGGTGVVTGTTPNLILMATIQEFPGDTGLNFATWMGFNIPGMVICVVLAFIWLQFYFMRSKGGIGDTSMEQMLNVKRTLQRKYDSLGPITFHESVVVTLFVILVMMWFFRSPEFIPGWASWFEAAFGSMIEVDDATPVMLIVILLFAIPKELNFWCFRDARDDTPVKRSEGCLTWSVVQEKIPWGIVLLLGGGFAMAEAADQSGLSAFLGEALKGLDVMPPGVIVLVVCLMTAMVTEVASNTATASILVPVLKEMSIGIEMNPIYVMLPAVVCCSYAFMLPVATPPNAIVFSASKMKTTEMMKAGLIMNVMCVIVINVMINTLGIPMFDVRHFPDWAVEGNDTTIFNALI